ncbi:M1 family aminopeptidase [soil metagenome]
MLRVCRFWLLAITVCAVCCAGSSSGVFAQPPGRRPTPPSTPAAVTPPAASPAAVVEPLRTASDRPVDIQSIRLDLKVDVKNKTIDGRASLAFRCVRPTRTLSLDAVDFDVKHVKVQAGGSTIDPARFTVDGKKLVVDLGSRFQAGQEGKVDVVYRLRDPKDGLHFFGPSKESPDAPLLLWSQGETSTNRYWIPCIDEPDQRQTTQIVVTVPEGFEAISNGKLVERHANPSDKTVTFDWKQEIPHPSYLATLVVGEFDVVTHDWEGIPVVYYVPKGRSAEAEPTYGRTPEMLTYFSKIFGVRYPWAKYAQVTCFQFGGGMENTTATTMGDRILVDRRSLLDRTSEGIVAHELAHQWWGDMVTCRDWSHTWLNEGFASYAEALWDEHARGRDDYAYNMDRKAGRAIAGGKERPVMDLRYVDPQSMFDDRSYPKGAWVVHMLRNRLGDDAFWKGIKQYGTEHKFHSVETVDLRRSLERATGRDLERFFYDWLERAGNPDVAVTTDYLPDAQQARLTIQQTQAGDPFEIPLKIVLTCAGAKEPLVLEEIMSAKELKLVIPLPGPLERVDVDPDQAILTELKETKPRALWEAQLLGAPNVPARLRAAQHFAQSKAEPDQELLARAFAQEKFWGVKLEIAAAMGTSKGEPCKQALLKGLKDEDARVRRASVDGLAKFGPDATVAGAVKEILQKGDLSYAVEGAALAAYAKVAPKEAVAEVTPWLTKPSHQDLLASAALGALAATEDPAVVDTLMSWTKTPKPSNLRAAALRGLAQLLKSKRLTEAQRQQIAKTIVANLDTSDSTVRLSVLLSLPDLGPLASLALPTLEKQAQTESRSAVKNRIRTMANRIRAQASPTTSGNEVTQLRDEVKRLQRDQEELRKRLEKFEASGNKKEPAK